MSFFGPRVLENANWTFTTQGCRNILDSEVVPKQERQIVELVQEYGPMTRLELVIKMQEVMSSKRRMERVLSDLQTRLRRKGLLTWTVPEESHNAYMAPPVPRDVLNGSRKNDWRTRSAERTRRRAAKRAALDAARTEAD